MCMFHAESRCYARNCHACQASFWSTWLGYCNSQRMQRTACSLFSKIKVDLLYKNIGQAWIIHSIEKRILETSLLKGLEQHYSRLLRNFLICWRQESCQQRKLTYATTKLSMQRHMGATGAMLHQFISGVAACRRKRVLGARAALYRSGAVSAYWERWLQVAQERVQVTRLEQRAAQGALKLLARVGTRRKSWCISTWTAAAAQQRTRRLAGGRICRQQRRKTSLGCFRALLCYAHDKKKRVAKLSQAQGRLGSLTLLRLLLAWELHCAHDRHSSSGVKRSSSFHRRTQATKCLRTWQLHCAQLGRISRLHARGSVAADRSRSFHALPKWAERCRQQSHLRLTYKKALSRWHHARMLALVTSLHQRS